MSELVDTFMATPFGAKLSTDEVEALLQGAEEKTLMAGQFLCHAGDSGNSIYFVLAGRLDVVLGDARSGETVLAKVQTGQFAGELEMLTHTLRVASLKAGDDTRVLEIPAARIEELVAENHSGVNRLIYTIAKTVSRRLTTANEHILNKVKEAANVAAGAAPQQQPDEIQELSDDDVIALDDEDLEVLDKLWS